MDAPQRFTLRKEYFGGIIHDATEMMCDILSPDAFDLFRQMSSGKEFTETELASKGEDTRKVIETLRKKEAIVSGPGGRLVLVNTRYIIPPEKIPDGCLTAPIRIYDTYTRKCNLRCKQCCISSWADFHENRRTIKQTEIIMRKFYEAGTPEWRFTGGEPTSCPDLLDAINIARGFGMGVMLNTNGCWNDTLLEKIPETGVFEIVISLEGREEINDRRRAPGVFKNIIRVLDRIAQHNKDNPDRKIKVTLNMTIAQDNVSDVEFVVRLGARYGYNVNFVPLRPYGRTVTELKDTILSTKGFMKFSENVQRLREVPEIRDSGIRIIHRNMDLFCPDYPDKSQTPFPFNYSTCGALATGFGLCPDGRVNACTFLMNDPEFIGPSMLEVSVFEAWLHSKMERIRRAKRIECQRCRFYMCQCEGKCVAMVLANNGKIEKGHLIGRDPYCFGPLMPKN